MMGKGSELFYSVLHLFIILFGLALVIGGPKGVKAIFRFFWAPLARIAAIIWFLLVLFLITCFFVWWGTKIFPDFPFWGLLKSIATLEPKPGFDYPVGVLENGRRSGGGWWVAQDFADIKNPAQTALKGQHLGEDWNMGEGSDDAGEWVYSIGNGDVIKAEANDSYGHYVMILHPLPSGNKQDFIVSLYGHLATNDLIAKGAKVFRGTPIGRIGGPNDNGFYRSRNADGLYQLDENGNAIKHSWPVHLHFEIRVPTARFKPDEIGVWGYSSDKTGFVNPTSATSKGNKPAFGWLDTHR